MALFHIYQVKHSYFITFFFQKIPGISQIFPFWIKHHKRGIRLHQIRLCKKSGLSGTRTANYNRQYISQMFPHVITDLHMHGQQLIFCKPLLLVSAIYFLHISPFSRTMFFTSSVMFLGRNINPDSHAVRQQKNKESFYTVPT